MTREAPYSRCPLYQCNSQKELVADGVDWVCPDCKLRVSPDSEGGWIVTNWKPIHVNLVTGETTGGYVIEDYEEYE
jgi:hypothetical protein